MPFSSRPNRKCLRGLHFIYRTEPALDPQALAAALDAAHAHRLVRVEESWRERTVLRLVLQFQVEYRINERPGEISLIHRVSASPETRTENVSILERTLAALLRD